MSKWLYLQLWLSFAEVKRSKQSYKKRSVTNDWEFQISKMSISPNYEWDIMMTNIPCKVRNPRDINSQLSKTVYCGLEIITFKGQQLWKQLPKKMKNVTSYWACGRPLSCGKTLNAHGRFVKRTLEDWDTYKKSHTKLFYFCCVIWIFGWYKLVLVTICFFVIKQSWWTN